MMTRVDVAIARGNLADLGSFIANDPAILNSPDGVVHVDPMTRHEKRYSVLNYAAVNAPGEEVCRFLVEKGADLDLIDVTGQTPLMASATYEKIPTLSCLLSMGADVNKGNQDGVTALHCAAAAFSDVAVLRILLEAGANPDARTVHGNTPMHLLASDDDENSPVDVLARLRVLIKHGADPHARNEKGEAALERACRSICSRDAGADVAEQLRREGLL